MTDRSLFDTTPDPVALYNAVLARAVTDLLAETAVALTDKDRFEAMRFLTDAEGPWARSREDICTILDRDPDEVRASIIAILEGGVAPSVRGAGGARRRELKPDSVARARALWLEHNRPPYPTPAPTPDPTPEPEPAPTPEPTPPRVEPPPFEMPKEPRVTLDDVLAFIRSRPAVRTVEIAAHFAITDVTVMSRLTNLKKQGRVANPHPGCYHCPSKPSPAEWPRLKGRGTKIIAADIRAALECPKTVPELCRAITLDLRSTYTHLHHLAVRGEVALDEDGRWHLFSTFNSGMAAA